MVLGNRIQLCRNVDKWKLCGAHVVTFLILSHGVIRSVICNEIVWWPAQKYLTEVLMERWSIWLTHSWQSYPPLKLCSKCKISKYFASYLFVFLLAAFLWNVARVGWLTGPAPVSHHSLPAPPQHNRAARVLWSEVKRKMYGKSYKMERKEK